MNGWREWRVFASLAEYRDYSRRVAEKLGRPRSEFESDRHKTVGLDAAIRAVDREARMRPEFL